MKRGSTEAIERTNERTEAVGSGRSRRAWLGGQQVQVWENPDVPFGNTPEHLRAYVEQNDWVLLFNALALLGPTTVGMA